MTADVEPDDAERGAIKILGSHLAENAQAYAYGVILMRFLPKLPDEADPHVRGVWAVLVPLVWVEGQATAIGMVPKARRRFGKELATRKVLDHWDSCPECQLLLKDDPLTFHFRWEFVLKSKGLPRAEAALARRQREAKLKKVQHTDFYEDGVPVASVKKDSPEWFKRHNDENGKPITPRVNVHRTPHSNRFLY